MNNDELNNIQNKLDAYRAGKLSEQEIDQLWKEMIENPDHLDYLVNSVNLQAIAEQQKQKSSSKTKKSGANIFVLYGLQGTWGRIAAIFVLTVGLLSTIYLFGSEYLFEQDPVTEIELDAFRSTTLPTAVFDHQIQRAINMASLERYDDAIDLLREIELAHLSEDQQVSLKVNKGSILYNRGDYHAAKVIFLEILDDHDDLHVLTEERVQWFLGNVYLQLGQEELAEKHIQNTYDLNGAYRRLAERYLEEIE